MRSATGLLGTALVVLGAIDFATSISALVESGAPTRALAPGGVWRGVGLAALGAVAWWLAYLRRPR